MEFIGMPGKAHCSEIKRRLGSKEMIKTLSKMTEDINSDDPDTQMAATTAVCDMLNGDDNIMSPHIQAVAWGYRVLSAAKAGSIRLANTT